MLQYQGLAYDGQGQQQRWRKGFSKAVTGAVTHGGLIQLTVTAHGLTSGERADVAAVGGVPNATGNWAVAVINANTVDLVGTTFGGAYTSGGTVLRRSSFPEPWQRITGAAAAATLVRITSVAHGFATNQWVQITGVLGTTEANGIWKVTTITADTFDLQNSTFTNAYTSGGNAAATFHPDNFSRKITGAVTDGGLIKITAAGHEFVTGQGVQVAAVTGTTEANGNWKATVIDANNFDLQGSVFTNAYVSGGTATRIAP